MAKSKSTNGTDQAENTSPFRVHIALLLLRIGTGGILAVQGYPKLFGGNGREAPPLLGAVLGKNFRLGSGAARRLDAFLALDNATDSAVYDQCGLPRPGRLLRLEIRIF